MFNTCLLKKEAFAGQVRLPREWGKSAHVAGEIRILVPKSC